MILRTPRPTQSAFVTVNQRWNRTDFVSGPVKPNGFRSQTSENPAQTDGHTINCQLKQ